MVLPIIIGVGVTIAALTTRSLLLALNKYKSLSNIKIAQLNNIRINHLSQNNMNVSNQLRSKFLQNPGGFQSKMNEIEAMKILNIDDVMNVDKAQIIKNYKKLMMQNHPDKNGSKYIALKINEAKSLLDKSYMFRK